MEEIVERRIAEPGKTSGRYSSHSRANLSSPLGRLGRLAGNRSGFKPTPGIPVFRGSSCVLTRPKTKKWHYMAEVLQRQFTGASKTSPRYTHTSRQNV